jgi:hypothetical protein
MKMTQLQRGLGNRRHQDTVLNKTLRTSSGGQFHLSEISALRTLRNWPLLTTGAFARLPDIPARAFNRQRQAPLQVLNQKIS